MFYPVESLKRGGRFYLCWVADSWPQRFNAINNRQILSQDIRRICRELQEVICQESGRPSKRFSLRLTSQLIHGLVLLYHRKVNVLIGDICMIEAHVLHHSNKRWVDQVRIHDPRLPRIPRLVIEEVRDDARVEELLQGTENVVAHVEDITLREPVLPENQLHDDGFGEMHLDLPVISDRTIELMLGPDGSAAQHSIIDPWGVSPVRLIDQLGVNQHANMERASEHDMSLFNKTTGAELQAPEHSEKEIPDIQLPEIPDPKEPQVEKEIPMEIERIQLEEIPIEEYDAQHQPKKQKRALIKKDVCVKLSSAYLRARIDDNKVELRCQDPAELRIRPEVTLRQLFHRPTCAGPRITNNLGFTITKLYLRRLNDMERHTVIDVPEAVMTERPQQESRMVIDKEATSPAIRPPQLVVQEREISILDMCAFGPNVTAAELNVSAPNVSVEANASVPEPIQDISMMPTQKIAPEWEVPSISKRRRTDEGMPITDTENKENEPPNQLDHISVMLNEAGIADVPEKEDRTRKDSSETPLGSLDRTKVSLGESDSTTDSQRLIRKEWGTYSTMMRIIHCKLSECGPLNVKELLAHGPVLPGHGRFTAAKCFSSLLKLKQCRFIRIEKNPVTLEIVDINLGPRFDQP